MTVALVMEWWIVCTLAFTGFCMRIIRKYQNEAHKLRRLLFALEAAAFNGEHLDNLDLCELLAERGYPAAFETIHMRERTPPRCGDECIDPHGYCDAEDCLGEK